MCTLCILTCEHASNAVPRQFRSLFATEKAVLQTHRAYDIGAKQYAMKIASSTLWPLFCGSWTRLLVDLNRSIHHPQLFSRWTKPLDEEAKAEVLATYYYPFRTEVQRVIQGKVEAGDRVIHLSCHSFTPVLGDVERMMDLGILYDPRRSLEKDIAQEIRRKLIDQTSMTVRCNAPYRGVSDGHVTALRKLFPQDQYIGIELELNQSLYVPRKSEVWHHVWLPRLVEILRSIPEE